MARHGDHLYFIQEQGTGHIKIGRSVDPKRRVRSLQTGNAKRLKLIAYFKGKGDQEAYLHELLRDWRLKGEWFSVDCVGSIPESFYEQIEWGAFDDWWKS